MHARDLARGTLNAIIEASGVGREEFLKLLRLRGRGGRGADASGSRLKSEPRRLTFERSPARRFRPS